MSDVLENADLFVHTNRPSWGLAIHTDTRPNKVDLLFQDGTTRTFHTDYMHMLAPADKPRDVTTRVVNRLRQKADGKLRTPKIANADNVPSLSDQMRLFHHLFPMGFEDPGYIAQHRGAEDQRRKKSLHGLAAEHAQAELTRGKLRELLEAGNSQGVVDAVCDVMVKTSLAPRTAVKKLRANGVNAGMADQIYSTLYNTETCMFDRFTRWIMVLEKALGRGPTWAMATVIPALLDPEEHISVKRAPFQREAHWMAPSLELAKVPNAELYRRVRAMAQELRSTLTEAGLQPRDLLDVSAFVRIVMRPKHLEMLDEMPEVN